MSPIKSRKHAFVTAPPRLAGTALAALAGLTTPIAATAQAAAPPAPAASQAQLPEVRVRGTTTPPFKAETSSSPKLTQPLVDTPQTITVITKELVQQQAATTLTEALRNTPGITLLMGENGNTATGDSIFMRGFDTSGSIFVDGIRDLGTVSRDLFSIEQVEVSKGPAGADYGRGAASGYINLASKVPLTQRFATGSVTLGTSSRARVTADLNQPLDIGLAGTAFRLNVMGQDYDVPGRDEAKQKRWGFAPSIAFGLGTNTRTIVQLLHVKQSNRPDGGISTVGLDGFYNAAFDPNPSETYPDGGPNALAGLTRLQKVDRDNFYGSRDDYDDITADMFTVRVEHLLKPGFLLRNATRYGRTEQKYVLTGVNNLGNVVFPVLDAEGEVVDNLPNLDPGTYTLSRSRQRKFQRNEVITNQTNLNAEFATGAVLHSLVTGVEFIQERQYSPSFALPAGTTQDPANLYDPSLDDDFETPEPTGAKGKGTTLTAAVYAFDTIKLTERWQLNGGVRWEKYRTEYDATVLSTEDSDPDLPVGTRKPLSLSASDTLVSWKVGVLFKPASNGSVYLSYADSSQPPGGANFTLSDAPDNINNPNLDPQEATNIELGTKWDVFDGRLALTGALFRSENENDLTQVDSVDGTVTQYGKRRVQGIELGVVGAITPAWNLSAGLLRQNARIVEGTTTGGVTDGGTVQWSPKLAFTLWSSYRLPFGLTLGGGARYIDSILRSNNTVFTTPPNVRSVPSYWVFDALAAYEINPKLSVQLNVNNLFDKEYVAQLNNNGSRYVPGSPRNALVTANLKF